MPFPCYFMNWIAVRCGQKRPNTSLLRWKYMVLSLKMGLITVNQTGHFRPPPGYSLFSGSREPKGLVSGILTVSNGECFMHPEIFLAVCHHFVWGWGARTEPLAPQLWLALRMEPAFLGGPAPYSSLTGQDGKSARERNHETVFSHK